MMLYFYIIYHALSYIEIEEKAHISFFRISLLNNVVTVTLRLSLFDFKTKTLLKTFYWAACFYKVFTDFNSLDYCSLVFIFACLYSMYDIEAQEN